MKKINKKTLLGITLAVILVLTGAKLTQAQVQRTITIVPPSIPVNLNPGEKTEGKMKVINDSDTPLTFKATIQDYIVEDGNGTPRILPPDTLDKRYTASAWIGVYPDKFTVEPHQKQELNYYIQVPQDARPGGHYAAVVYTPGGEAVQGTGASVEAKMGTLFLIGVNGNINEQASISKFLANFFNEYGPVNVLTTIRNAGDLHIKPVGSITVTDLLGRKTTVNLKENNVFPGGGVRNYENAIGQKWMIGPYTAKLAASYGKNNNLPLTAVVTFWVFPWKIAMLVVLVIVLIVLGIAYLEKGKKQNGPKDQKHEEETPQTPTEQPAPQV